MCEYVIRIAATYYFRRAVPAELQPFILTRTGSPRTEWRISLRTTDLATAKKHRRPYVDMTEQEFAAARAKLAQAGSLGGSGVIPGAGSMDPIHFMSEEAWERQQAFEAEETRQLIAEDEKWEATDAYVASLPKDHPAAMIAREAAATARSRDQYRRQRYQHIDGQRQQGANDGAAPLPSQDHPVGGAQPAITITKVFDGYASQEGPISARLINSAPS